MSEVTKPQFPGSIAVANERGHFPGCKAEFVGSITDLNKFFDDNKGAGYLLVDLKPCNGGFFFLYSKTLTEGEREWMDQWAAGWEEFKEKKRQEQWEAERVQREEEERLAREESELKELGRRCKNNHGAVIDENSKLKAEVKKLRKGKS